MNGINIWQTEEIEYLNQILYKEQIFSSFYFS